MNNPDALREQAERSAQTLSADALLDRYTEAVKLSHYNPHAADPSAAHMLGRDVALWVAVDVLRAEIDTRLKRGM